MGRAPEHCACCWPDDHQNSIWSSQKRIECSRDVTGFWDSSCERGHSDVLPSIFILLHPHNMNQLEFHPSASLGSASQMVGLSPTWKSTVWSSYFFTKSCQPFNGDEHKCQLDFHLERITARDGVPRTTTRGPNFPFGLQLSFLYLFVLAFHVNCRSCLLRVIWLQK